MEWEEYDIFDVINLFSVQTEKIRAPSYEQLMLTNSHF